ncbi:MFS transporter [Kitasatospora sp. MMS16-BH015]|uniref:MFS transporter n=1 Tax=Kitasatospora sp. MMS16-BH015 TaxID=2018025 RepID=UPI000CA3A352|nr:MFS transporter [Kitasatospora sp. MMS16-BH015]AUG75098.1 MFS transporter [Kitasatospora sp. MMS16-BH015]
MRGLWGHRNARLFLAGQILSTFGDSALWLAMGIWVKMLTGSASAAGLAFFMLTLGTLTGPLGGVLADRLRRRPLLIAANLATAALVLLLLLVHDRDQVWLVHLVMFGYGVSAGVLGPAQVALQQSMLPEELFAGANSALQTAQSGMRLVTPLLGAGLLATLGATPVILGDVLTFLVAVAALAAVRIREDRPVPSERHWLAEAAAGARHIGRTRPLRQLALAGALAVTAFGLCETVFFAVVAKGLHRPDTFLGVLVSVQGVGAIAAGLTAGALVRRYGEGRLVALGLACGTLAFLLLTPSSTPAVLAGSALLGASMPWLNVGIMTLFQRRTPAELMGRTDAALGLLLSTPQSVAVALGAALIAVTDYRLLLLLMAALMALAAVFLLTRPEHRRPAPPEPPTVAP